MSALGEWHQPPVSSGAVIDAARDYGIKADGASDDTSRWQALAADAEAEIYGAEIVLPVGVTRTTAPIEFTADNLTLRGPGQGNPKGGAWANRAATPTYGGCVFRPLASFVGDYVLKFWQGGVPVRVLGGIFLEGFSLDGFDLPAAVGGIDFQVFNGGMESITVARVTGSGFVIEGAGSTNYPQDAYDLRLHALKADTVGGDGFKFIAGAASDLVLSDSKAVLCGGYLLNNGTPGLQLLGFHGYQHSGPAAIYTVTRSLVVEGLRLSDIDKHGILLVDDAAHTGSFVIDGLNARDVGKLADNTYDVINYAPGALTRGGKIGSAAISTMQANRPRYFVNPSANVADLEIEVPALTWIAPATSSLATALVPTATPASVRLGWRRSRERAQGLLAQDYDRDAVISASAMVGGTAYAMLVELQEGDLVSDVVVACNSAGVGVSLFKAGIYSLDGTTRYAATADESAQFGAIGVKSLPLTAAWQVPATGSYYVVIVATAATTLPSLIRTISGIVTAAAALAGAAQPFGTCGTGLADLPAPPLAFATVATIAYWVGLT